MYSLIEHHQAGRPAVVFGVVVFHDGEPLVRLLDAPPAELRAGARWMMAARAVVARLRRATPHTVDEVRAFLALEGNEMRLGSPQTAPEASSPLAALEALVTHHLRWRTVPHLRHMTGSLGNPVPAAWRAPRVRAQAALVARDARELLGDGPAPDDPSVPPGDP